MANNETPYVNINGIPKEFVHEKTSEAGNTYYNVGITVPFECSRNGIANVRTNKISPCKNDPNKYNLGFPKDWELEVSVCKYNDKDNSANNKYETVKMSPNQLLSEHINYLKAKNERTAEATVEATAEKEEDGMDR